MERDWDSYLCQVDGSIASIMVDLALARRNPDPALGLLAYLRLFMRRPRPDGLSSQEEFDTLNRIEDAIDAVLAESGQSLFIGRNTSAGMRDFLYYVADVTRFERDAARALAAFTDYKYEIGHQPDPDWRVYREFLYPSPAAMNGIQNRRVLRNLEKHGDRLTVPREIMHWAYFPNADSRRRFIERITAERFEVKDAPAGPDEKGAYRLRFARTDLPSHAGIDKVTGPLLALATELGGDYAGWESQVIRN